MSQKNDSLAWRRKTATRLRRSLSSTNSDSVLPNSPNRQSKPISSVLTTKRNHMHSSTSSATPPVDKLLHVAVTLSQGDGIDTASSTSSPAELWLPLSTSEFIIQRWYHQLQNCWSRRVIYLPFYTHDGCVLIIPASLQACPLYCVHKQTPIDKI